MSKVLEWAEEHEESGRLDENFGLLTQKPTEAQVLEQLPEDRHMHAVQLHQYIKIQGRIVAQGLAEIGRSLKEMRDQKLYLELGHDTFAAYGKDMLGLEQRQLYSYIQVYETYGPRFIDEHAELGISKLLLLANVPAPERDGFVEENDLESMTVRQLKELTDQYNQAMEQMTLMQTKNTELDIKLQERAAGEKLANTELAQQLEREKAAAEEATQKLEEERQRYREAEKKMAQQMQEQAEQDIAAARAKAEKEIKAAKAAAEAQAGEKLQGSLSAMERDKAEALERAVALEKKLEVAANPDTVYINFLLESMQEQLQKVVARIDNMKDQEGATKFRAAVTKVLEAMRLGLGA